MLTDKRISSMKVTLIKQTPLSIQDKFLGIIVCIMYAYLQVPFKKQGIKNYIVGILKKFSIY
jgi:hypothetical protein